MKLTKGIITEIKKENQHKKFRFEMFYKVKYMDNTTKSYLLPTDDYTTAREWFRDWSSNLNDRIHKEVHIVLLQNNGDVTSVESYKVHKALTDYADDYKPQVF